MYVKHLAADMKLHRARQVLGRLENLQQDYLASGAVRVEPSGPPWRLRVDEPPPVELSRLAGAALHTARRALDDLAVSLVIASRRTPRHTTFPIAASAHDFPDELSRCLRRANEKAREAVRSVGPWKGADDLLWDLHLLGEVERPPIVRLVRPAPPVPVRVPTALQVLQAHPVDDASTPVVDGRLLVLGDGEHVRGHPVVASIDRLITHADAVVTRVVEVAERH